MPDQPIDPAATPDNDDAPEIAADDAGASAATEQAQTPDKKPGQPGEDVRETD
jgi:hypothetical protein